jgi:hypothetical protein
MAEAHEDETEFGSAVGPGERPHPGDIITDGDALIAPEPLVGRGESTPLDEEEPEGIVPEPILWAMKDRRHVQWHLLAQSERHERLRQVFGAGDEAVYVIDDGKHHAMLARFVGSSPSGCLYCLVGRVSREALALVEVAMPLKEAFAAAEELALCGVAVEEAVASSNVFEVDRYAGPGEIPQGYLPGSPVRRFSADLEISAY